MQYDYTFSGLGLSTILVLNEMFKNNLLETWFPVKWYRAAGTIANSPFKLKM